MLFEGVLLAGSMLATRSFNSGAQKMPPQTAGEKLDGDRFDGLQVNINLTDRLRPRVLSKCLGFWP